MTISESKTRKPSKGARAFSARLAAVQAVYQNHHNPKPLQALLKDYAAPMAQEEAEESAGPPDGALLHAVVSGVAERQSDLEALIRGHYKKEKAIEPLLQAILLCGSYELLAHGEIEAPLIINDYLNITHGFYERGEPALVNGILDAVSRSVKSF